jgi:hypothetical protein
MSRQVTSETIAAGTALILLESCSPVATFVSSIDCFATVAKIKNIIKYFLSHNLNANIFMLNLQG